MTQTSGFVVLSPDIWRLDDSVNDANRRKMLLAPPAFDQIVSTLCAHATIASICTDPKKKGWDGPPPVPKRITVVLEFKENERLVDLFHNSASGVRAQCLHNVPLGDVALNYARDKLRSKAIERIADRRIGTDFRDFIFRSLAHDSTKIWIHQGHWVRFAKMAERHLRIAEWEANEASTDKKIRKLLRYGSKAPEHPAAIDVIGGYLHPSGPVAGKDPSIRPKQIHYFGFT